MTEIEILPPGLSKPDLEALQRAAALVERDSLANKLTRAVGGNVEWVGRQLPGGAKKLVARATESALKTALRLEIGRAHV